MAHMVFCTKYRQEMEGLDEPPFDSDFGQKIYKNVSKKAWGEWVERQKMLLNEYRLQPWTREAQDFLVEQMNGFFFGEGGSLPKEYVRPHIRAASGRRPNAPDTAVSRRGSCTLRAGYTPRSPAWAARCSKCRDVAQPGRAHPWGG